MDSPIFEPVPEPQREPARSALAEVFGPAGVTAIERVSGGASGALTYRVEAEGRSFFLRIEARLDAPFRNPHQYDCMRIAAEAGIAPPLRYADAGTGTAIMDFMPTRPLTDYPGGPPALARDLGRLVARLQQTSPFPAHFEFPKIVAWLLGHLRTSGLFADGLLDAHAAGFERIREAYVWDPAECVSSHNEPNPNNVIFDGERLWLIDWESACRNDRLTDVAILTQYLVPAPELQAALVESWLGRPPDAYLSARLTLMRQLTRLYYAGLLFSVAARGARAEPETDLDAPTPAEFGAAVAAGRHTPGSPETMCVLGKMSLAAFRAGLDDPGFEESLAIARAG